MRTALFVRCLPLAAVLCAGCIIEAPSGEKSNPNKVKAVVNNVPPVNVPNGANLENKVEIVAATLSPGQAVPGEPVKVTAYFRVLEELEANYMVFVHVEDADGRVERANVDHAPAGGLYPTSQWKKGETVKDEFTIFVPSGGSLRALNLFIGFWEPKTDSRLRLMNPEKVRNDGNNRILLAQLGVAPM